MASLTSSNSDNQSNVKGKTLADFDGDIDAFKKYFEGLVGQQKKTRGYKAPILKLRNKIFLTKGPFL